MPTSFSPKSSGDRQPVQKALWDSYLASGRGGHDLFTSVDLDGNGSISASEVVYFFDSVEREGVHPDAFMRLETLSTDHELDLKEFLSWLTLSTKLEPQSMTSHKEAYEAHPEVGERRVDRLIKEREMEEEEEEEEEKIYAWNESTMSQALRRMQYAVRGEVVMKAEALKSEGRKIVFTNIGNPQALGQKPITFFRQVLALCELPAECGVDHPDADKLFPRDVLAKARDYRAAIGPAGAGAYSHSQGIAAFRQKVVDFIAARDGHPSYRGDVFLTNGASSAIQTVLTALIASDRDGIMIPIPQYPIYSALIALQGGRQIGYELDEDNGWAVTREELERRLKESQEKGITIKALTMINPGNPTGQVLDREALQTICTFCADNGIVLLADEVYQRNIYVDNKEFLSAKKVALETVGCEDLELVSFHSTSKGFIGECGKRGGYMELHNICPYVHSQLYKMASSGLCSSIDGQIMTALMVDPPKPGEESYESFEKEEQGIYKSLRRRAIALVEGLNKIEGIQCEPAEGALYAFPSVKLPPKAVIAAEKNHQTPDTLYAISLLEEEGICVVPASGFGQKEGRYGFRTTILPPEDELADAIEGFARHHEKFTERFA